MDKTNKKNVPRDTTRGTKERKTDMVKLIMAIMVPIIAMTLMAVVIKGADLPPLPPQPVPGKLSATNTPPPVERPVTTIYVVPQPQQVVYVEPRVVYVVPQPQVVYVVPRPQVIVVEPRVVYRPPMIIETPVYVNPWGLYYNQYSYPYPCGPSGSGVDINWGIVGPYHYGGGGHYGGHGGGHHR